MLDAPHAGAVSSRQTASAPALPRVATRLLVPLFATTLFFSSLLMFAVEPMVARQMLPVLGGVPMVWSGCVVFFQAVLLAGYGSAHVLTRGLAAPVRLLVYAGLAVLPLAFARLGVDAESARHATGAPLSWLLVALLTTVGPSFLVLAVSASVLQATFSSTSHGSARDPYFLYVASNAGSLAALVAYPTVIEPLLGLSSQAQVWSVGYGVFVVLVLVCALATRFALSNENADVKAAPAAASTAAADTPTWNVRARWCALAAVPSSLMLGVTTSLTTDISPVPLLWVAPLALYLATFIVAFSGVGTRATSLADRLLPAPLLCVATVLFVGATMPLVPALIVHLSTFLFAALLCHGRLAQERPSAQHLTEFYFWMALGGMVGGLFNTLAAPFIFSRVVEYPAALALVAFLRPLRAGAGPRLAVDRVLPVMAAAFAGAVLFVPGIATNLPLVISSLVTLSFLALSRRHRPFTLGGVAAALLVASPWIGGDSVLHAERTFFGIYRVSEDRTTNHHRLKHGTTLHGSQSLDPARRLEPLTYFHRTGPFGNAQAAIPRLRQPGEVAVIGLGVGTMAAYAQPGQQWTFFEIDPAIERIARDGRYFSFLAACGAACDVVLGDARLSLAQRSSARYDLIVLDAFSSDAIPMHLLTNEAMRVYLSRLAPGGVLAFHISNRHLVLNGIVGRLAEVNRLVALQKRDRKKTDGWPLDKAGSEWAMLARAREDLGALTSDPTWTALPVDVSTPLWTDDFSNVLSVLQIRAH
jgi:SAM-dependent methyltransferase